MVREQLRTPRSAAIAGIAFSVLLIAALVLIRAAVPADPREQGAWLTAYWGKVMFGLQLLPFAGIAFLWFIGVVRDRLGDREDRLFATVFLGSGLLFLAMLFMSAAVAGGLLVVYREQPGGPVSRDTYAFGRAVTYVIMNTYAMRMAGVFMISTCTLFLRTAVGPRWMAFLGYALALLLLLTTAETSWSIFVFPLWVLLISVDILVENYRRGAGPMATSGAETAER